MKQEIILDKSVSIFALATVNETMFFQLLIHPLTSAVV